MEASLQLGGTNRTRKRRHPDPWNQWLLEARRCHAKRDYRHGLLNGRRDLTRFDLGKNQRGYQSEKGLRAGERTGQGQVRSLSSGGRSAHRERTCEEFHCKALRHNTRKLLVWLKKKRGKKPKVQRAGVRIGIHIGFGQTSMNYAAILHNCASQERVQTGRDRGRVDGVNRIFPRPGRLALPCG